jgi:hypothetical protein
MSASDPEPPVTARCPNVSNAAHTRPSLQVEGHSFAEYVVGQISLSIQHTLFSITDSIGPKPIVQDAQPKALLDRVLNVVLKTIAITKFFTRYGSTIFFGGSALRNTVYWLTQAIASVNS